MKNETQKYKAKSTFQKNFKTDSFWNESSPDPDRRCDIF